LDKLLYPNVWIKKRKEQIEREIESITEGIDFSIYHDATEIGVSQIELALFNLWVSIIEEEEEESSDDVEIKQLATRLRKNAADVQAKEFPVLRKKYVEIFSKQMWEHDVEISVNGAGNKYINITGGIFAANKNKQDFQNQIHNTLNMYRFNQSRYRWYKGEDEYTYWTVFEGKDSDIMEIK
jgi:pyruvate/oxaloacetate carboxyltransferase